MQTITNKKGTLDCTMVKENKKTIWVKLSTDGNIIKRHKVKHKIIQ